MAANAIMSTTVSWQLAWFAGAIVLVVAGVVGLRRRSLTPARAVTVLGMAIVVAAIAWVGSRFPSGWFVAGIAGSATIAGALMAVAIVTAPQRRIR